MQGWRVRMEDAHFVLPALPGQGWLETAAFGVMDGHGGMEVARFCEQRLPREIARGSSADPSGALVAAFNRMDDLLSRETPECDLRPFSDGVALRRCTGRELGCGWPGGGVLAQLGLEPKVVSPDWVGCTCIVCLVRADTIIVANAGDSRAVLSRGGKAVPLSEDHKPNLPIESERIHKAGGCVVRQQVGSTVQFRVNGNLNLSRSIGDLQYKKNSELSAGEQMICSTPDVQTFKREADDEFLLLACDGVWDVLSNQDAVDFVHKRLKQYLQTRRPLSGIMEDMLDYCISPDLAATNGLGGDNMTAVLVLFCGTGQGATPGSTAALYHSILEDATVTPAGLCSCSRS